VGVRGASRLSGPLSLSAGGATSSIPNAERGSLMALRPRPTRWATIHGGADHQDHGLLDRSCRRLSCGARPPPHQMPQGPVAVATACRRRRRRGSVRTRAGYSSRATCVWRGTRFALRPVLYEMKVEKTLRFSQSFERPRLFGLRFVFPKSQSFGRPPILAIPALTVLILTM
jgi:hypothetical protein